MKTIIKNGTILTSDEEFKGDILVEDEKIAAVGGAISCGADKILDAAGMYVMPGGVDQHTHFSALCNVGNKDTAEYDTTDAVLVGGTTTIVDYAPQDPGKSMLDSIDYRINVRAKGKACVDFALHALITEVSDDVFGEIRRLPENGIASVKAFMAYNRSPLHMDDGSLYRVMEKSGEAGVTVFVHAENGEIIEFLRGECVRKGQTEPKYHYISRPAFTESEAVQRAICLAGQCGTPLFIVHMTCRGALEELLAAKGKGQRVFGETCTQYLTTTKEVLDNPDFNEAAKYVCSPALRDAEDCEALWGALDSGLLSAVVSDHCGIDLAELKQAGRNDFTQIPNGAPGAADRLHMLWTYGVETGKITKNKLVEVFATQPAKINGIYPRKGRIGVGADADIVIFDPTYRGVIRLADNPNGVDYNIYEGREIKGRTETVLLRGKVVVENARFKGTYGQGQFIPSKPYGACYRG